MTCREFAEFLDDYFAGEIEASRREVFERHLSVCRDCRNYLSSYRGTVELSKAAFGTDDELPLEVPAKLISAIIQARASS